MKRSSRKTALYLLGAAALGTLLATGIHAQPSEEVEVGDAPLGVVDDLMLAKLECAQNLMEAIVREDYEGIEVNAQKLTILSLDAGWQVLQTPQYARHSEDFRRNTQAITLAGRNENLDAAVLGYLDMTMTCVECHRYVRNPELADALELPELPVDDQSDK